MKQTLRIFSALLLLVAMAATAFAQSERSTIFEQGFAEGFGAFEPQNYYYPYGETAVEGLPQGLDAVWTIDQAEGAAVASAHVGAVKYNVNSYLFSNKINLSGYTGCKFSFENSANDFGKKAEEALENIYYKAYPMAVACKHWDDLTIENISDYVFFPKCTAYPTGMDDEYVLSGCDLSYLDGEEVYIAFIYCGSDAVNGVWRIKNIVVEGFNAEGVKEVVATIPVTAQRYDLSGRTVKAADRGVVIENGVKILK